MAAEWSGDPWGAYAAWKQARREWVDANYPPGAISPLGDRIDMLLFERDARRQLPPDPRGLRGPVHWTNGPPPDWQD